MKPGLDILPFLKSSLDSEVFDSWYFYTVSSTLWRPFKDDFSFHEINMNVRISFFWIFQFFFCFQTRLIFSLMTTCSSRFLQVKLTLQIDKSSAQSKKTISSFYSFETRSSGMEEKYVSLKDIYMCTIRFSDLPPAQEIHINFWFF